MGLLRNLLGNTELPTFDLDTWYVNEDYGGEMKVVSRQPFLIQYDYTDQAFPVNRELYREKLSEGIIYKPDENL